MLRYQGAAGVLLGLLFLSTCSVSAKSPVGAAGGEVSPDSGSGDTGSVVVAQFTTAIENGEPISDLTEVMNSVPEIYFYTEVDGLRGQTIHHRWRYGRRIIKDVQIRVKDARFRTWSSCTIQPEWTGAWFVDVIDGNGRVIASKTFAYLAPL